MRVKPQLGRPQAMPRDVNATHWAYPALSDLAPKALIPMDEDGNYRGNKGLTLKDVAAHWNLFVETLKVVRIK